MLMQRKLLWVAVGAGLASAVWLSAYLSLAYATRDDRYLLLRSEHDDALDAGMIAAVGECRGHFKLTNTDHTTDIYIPVRSLTATQYTCLVDKLANVGDWKDPQYVKRLSDGKVPIRLDMRIVDAADAN